MTAQEVEPSKKKLLALSGICGILTPIVAWSLVSLAIFYAPNAFSFSQNWLSDLSGMGYASFMNVSRPLVSSPTTEILYRSAHVIGGVLGIIFTVGLFYDNDAPSHRMGAMFGVLGTAASCATGIFPEPTGIVHLTSVFASTLLISAAMFLIGGGANIDGAQKRVGGLSIALAIIALAGLSLFSYERGVAVVITFAAISVWAFAFGVRLIGHASL